MSLLSRLFARSHVAVETIHPVVPSVIPGLPFAEAEREHYRRVHFDEIARATFTQYVMVRSVKGWSEACDALHLHYWRIDDAAWWSV
jgi:hypothetical protein